MKPSIPLSVAAFLRFFIPGMVAFIFSWPCLESPYRAARIFSFLASQPSTQSAQLSATDVALAVTISFLFGLVVSLMDDPIYRLYEGIRMWPSWLSRLCQSRLEARVKRLYRTAEEIRYQDPRRYNAIWTKLLIFPLDSNGEPYTARPTKLGNILYTYEEYPNSRYRMSGIFYFPRIWFVVEEYNQKEFRAIEANSEAPLYISFVAAVFACFYLSLSLTNLICERIGINLSALMWEHPPKFILWGLTAMIVSVVFYRVSLPLHIVRGEHFKALFDLYRNAVEEKLSLSKELPTWRDKWAFLQYRKALCPKCGMGFPANLSKCTHCQPSEPFEKTVREYEEKVKRRFDGISNDLKGKS